MATDKQTEASSLRHDDASHGFSTELLRDGSLLLKMGIGKPLIADMMLLAQVHGTTVENELIASGRIEEAVYYEALAETLELSFLPHIDATRVQDIAGLDIQLLRPETLRIHHPSLPPVTVIVPSLSRLPDVARRIADRPALRHSLAVAPPSAVRCAAWQAGAQRRVAAAVHALFETAPLHSARITFHGKQGFYAGILVCTVAFLAVVLPLVSILMLHVVLTLLYLAHFLLRFYALLHGIREQMRRGGVPTPDTMDAQTTDAPLPVYSVLVALYKEESVVAQLVAALDRLDWPRSRLDIKLICEEDDHDTIAALRALDLAPEYDIVTVPVRFPRTKPKALAYALAGVRGPFVTVYDAEDRAAPGQLREAFAAFSRAPERLVCLQAPLIVTNARQSWLSALFALEYAGLFRGLLPMLASAGLPMPLGGTSNHFRTAALRAAGGWDPYNVTEDADLGLRLYRLGYRSGVLRLPTLEDAPDTLPVWLAQRTRWFKGWLQTWLVLMREPGRLGREMGWLGFTVFQILIAGMLLSSLAHPVVLGFLVYLVWLMLEASAHGADHLATGLFVIDIVNIFGSYAVFVALGRSVMNAREKRAVGWRWLYVPAYWLVTSLAAWRAVIELRRTPFVWNKTPHRPVGD